MKLPAKPTTANFILPYGVFKGKRIDDVPPSYLINLFEKKKLCAKATNYVKRNLIELLQKVETLELKKFERDLNSNNSLDVAPVDPCYVRPHDYNTDMIVSNVI